MADEKEEEPSIEEILDSIRQIISDDDEDGDTAVAEAPEEPAPAPEPEPEPEPAPEPEPEPEPEIVAEPAPEQEPAPDIALEDVEEEDVLELTPEMQQPVEEPSKATEEVEEGSILSDEAKSAALASMAKLASSMPVSRRPGYEGVTVEDIVRELLNPVIREWADGHLQDVVEKVVQKEISKLASRALDE